MRKLLGIRGRKEKCQMKILVAHKNNISPYKILKDILMQKMLEKLLFWFICSLRFRQIAYEIYSLYEIFTKNNLKTIGAQQKRIKKRSKPCKDFSVCFDV